MVISPNVEFQHPNFAHSQTENAFYSFDHENALLLQKAPDGTLQSTYPVVTSLGSEDFNKEIVACSITGVRFEFDDMSGNAHLWTLEKNNFGAKIRRFGIQNGICRYQTTTKSGLGTRTDEWVLEEDASNDYDVDAISVEYQNTYLPFDLAKGATSTFLNSVVDLTQGSRLVLGPSFNANYTGKVEELIVSSVNPATKQVFFETPTKYAYNSLTEAVYHTKILVFNNYGAFAQPGVGSLYILSAATGQRSGISSGGQYINVQSAAYDPVSRRTIYARGNQLMHYNSSTHTYSRSMVMNNTEEDLNGFLQVHDLALSSTTIYRLQHRAFDDDNGLVFQYSGPGIYNYVTTPLLPVVMNAAVHPDRINIFGDGFDKVFIKVMVHDQDGSPVPNTQVTIRAEGAAPGTFLTFGTGQDAVNPTDKMTADDGTVMFQYQSGINAQVLKEDERIDLIATLVEVGKEESAYVLQRRYWQSSDVLYQISGEAGKGILSQKVTEASTKIVHFLKYFSAPPTRSNKKTGTLAENYLNFYDGQHDIYWPYWRDELEANPGDSTNPMKSASWGVLYQKFLLGETETALFQGHRSDGALAFQWNRELSEGAIVHAKNGLSGEAELQQLNIIDEIIPAPFDIKVARATNIYIRLNDPGFPINESSIKLVVNGADVTSISSIGEDSLPAQTEIFYNPPVDFEFDQRVYVHLTFYDTASPEPNFFDFYYYFDIVPDLKAPVFTAIYPAKGEVGVPVDSSITFELRDIDNDVDPDSIILYVDNVLITNLEKVRISEGYRVTYTPPKEFLFSQNVSVYVEASDVVGNEMIQTYHFITEFSSPPVITSINPPNCAQIVHRDEPTVFEIYSDGDGVDLSTVKVNIDGRARRFLVSPYIRRTT